MSAEIKEKKDDGKGNAAAEEAIQADRDKRLDAGTVCQKAPEWAEHHRLWDEDEPCDDGRSGRLGEK